MIVNVPDVKSAVVRIPPQLQEVVALRIKQASYSKEKNRIDWETEIIHPDKVMLDGTEYVLAGQEVRFYNGLNDEISGNQKESPLSKLKTFHSKMGLPWSNEIDTDKYEGLIFNFHLLSYEKPIQRKTAEGKYETILDENGKPRTLGYQYSNFLDNVIGPSNVSVNEGGF